MTQKFVIKEISNYFAVAISTKQVLICQKHSFICINIVMYFEKKFFLQYFIFTLY